MQYDQDIHCLYLGIEGSEQPALLCSMIRIFHGLYLGIEDSEQPALLYSMTRVFTVCIWALKAQNSQRFSAVWSGHSLSISEHWRLRTASASVQYDQGIHCLYLGVEDSEQPVFLCSMIRAFTVYTWAMKAQNSQRVCAVWPGYSLSISEHWRLRTTSASVQYDQGIHCLYLYTEGSEQPALLCSMTRVFTVYICILKAQNSQRVCAVWPGYSLSIYEQWRLRTASASVQYDQGIHCLYLSIEGSEQPALLCSMTRVFIVYICILKTQNSQRVCAVWSGHLLSISEQWRLRTASASVQYDQGIHCLYLSIEGSEQPALRCSMTRVFTVYICILKTQNSQRVCAVWPGYSLSISEQWRLRTASASVQYDQGIHCLYLSIEGSEQPALLCSMTRVFTVYICILKAQNNQRFCAVWPGYSLSISVYWRLRTASASVQYDQGIHCLLKKSWAATGRINGWFQFIYLFS